MGDSTNQVRHPHDSTVGHDLDPDAEGDLVRTIKVTNAQALVVAVTSQDSEPVSVSVRFVASTDATDAFTTESASDIGLSGVTDDWSRLVRKGPVAEVTITSDASAGTTNRVNAWLDSHR